MGAWVGGCKGHEYGYEYGVQSHFVPGPLPFAVPSVVILWRPLFPLQNSWSIHRLHKLGAPDLLYVNITLFKGTATPTISCNGQIERPCSETA